MLGFILTVLFFVILWPLLRGLWLIGSRMYDLHRFMRDPEGELRRRARKAEKQRYTYNTSSRTAASHTAPHKGKKIPRDVGEYVAYTEIEVSDKEREADSTRTRTAFTAEEQITDIKWEDIK